MHLIWVRQNAVSFTDPAPGREAYPVPVGTAARRFCGAVPLISNPPAWISWQACPSAFQRPAGQFPAAMPSGLSPRRCLSVLSDTGLLHHTGSVPGCGAAYKQSVTADYKIAADSDTETE